MNLAGLETETTVEFNDSRPADEVVIGGEVQTGAPHERVVAQLNVIRAQAGLGQFARIESKNNFPSGAGIASSASAFAALTVAAAAAAGLTLPEHELSALARRGSGSAARSVPGGFVEWGPGEPGRPETSFGVSIAPPEHWDLVDVIAVVSQKHKATGSTGGHALAGSSPLQAARITSVPERLAVCREALLTRNFARFIEVVETDSNVMHAVMMSSAPPLFYWEPITLAIIKSVRRWRAEGLPVGYTIDAGPNVHCLCLPESAPEVERRLRENLDVSRILVAHPGGPARLLA